MGWCSATNIFDTVVGELLDEEKKSNKKDVIMALISELENGDWDCQGDSEYWEHPLIQEIFKELHPSWFENNEDDVDQDDYEDMDRDNDEDQNQKGIVL